MADPFDVMVIGAGQAAIPLVQSCAKAGKLVALVEAKHLGGSCVNFGCTPTKAAIASARLAHLARRANDFGLSIPTVVADFPRVIDRARSIAESSRAYLDKSMESSANPVLIRGSARLAGRSGEYFKVDIAGDQFLARQIVLDTGTRSRIPPLPGLAETDFIDSENWLDHLRLPTRLLVLGGGYIGLEMGQFYRRMGSRVTVLQQGSQIADHEDADVAQALQQLLEAEGIEFRLGVEVQGVQKTQQGVRVTVEEGGAASSIDGSDLFVAVGREPNTGDLGLESMSVKVNNRGIVETDKRLATSVPGIWAAGDIRGGPMFTHTSWDDYRILESQIIGDGSRTVERIVPYAVFTDPELGRVGMTEAEARAKGHRVKVARFEMKDNGKAKEIGETAGFVKLVGDEESRQLLGAAVLASEGAELVHLYIGIMNAGAAWDVVGRSIHIHPTLAEALQSAVSGLG